MTVLGRQDSFKFLVAPAFVTAPIRSACASAMADLKPSESAALTDRSSAFADIEVTKSVRRLQVTFLPFAHRWPRMSGLTVSECVLPTHFCRSDQRYRRDRFQDETVTRPFESQGSSLQRVLEDMFTRPRTRSPHNHRDGGRHAHPSRCNAAIDSRAAVESFAPPPRQQSHRKLVTESEDRGPEPAQALGTATPFCLRRVARLLENPPGAAYVLRPRFC